MTHNQYKLGAFALITVLVFAVIIGITSIKKHQIDADINAQKDIERTQIEQKAKTQRTRERMHWLPWYQDKKNETDEQIGSGTGGEE